MDKTTMATNMSIELLQGCEKYPELRLKKSAFTRNRKLGAVRILHMLLHRLSGSLQLEVDTYYDTKDTATALGSLAYGPLDHAIYDCQIAPYV